MAPVPLLPTQKCAHCTRTLQPLRTTSRVPAWLMIVLSACEFLCLPTFLPHRSGSPPATIFLCDSILWLNSLCSDLGAHILPGNLCTRLGLFMNPHRPPQWVLGKTAKTSIQKRELEQMGQDQGYQSGLMQKQILETQFKPSDAKGTPWLIKCKEKE